MNIPKVSEEEISLVGPILQRLMWADVKTREKIQKYGVNVLPINFYSEIPSIAEINRSYEYCDDEIPYLNLDLFQDDLILTTLKRITEFSIEFNPEFEGNEDNCVDFFWENSQFSYCDPMAYYCFVRDIKPNNIVEIGGGFSTLVGLNALEMNNKGIINCIEPFPRHFLSKIKKLNLIQKKAQDITRDFINSQLDEGDILFIDSTHTVKTGSDCLHIYLRLLPYITKDIYVHVHDIFLPDGMPKEWLLNKQIYWTEQYLLMALIIDNPKIEVIYSSHYNSMKNKNNLETFMGGKYPIGGSSFWFKYNGSNSL